MSIGMTTLNDKLTSMHSGKNIYGDYYTMRMCIGVAAALGEDVRIVFFGIKVSFCVRVLIQKFLLLFY